MWNKNYFVYITTNTGKNVLYVGITNDLSIRINQHYENRGNPKTFARKYYCYNLIYWERHDSPTYAIEREKQIKGWTRKKKEDLVKTQNPKWEFLNYSV